MGAHGRGPGDSASATATRARSSSGGRGPQPLLPGDEHAHPGRAPVTEMVPAPTWWVAVRIAQGEELPFAQDDLRQSGHASSAASTRRIRIAASCRARRAHRLPRTGGPGIRDDAGVYQGFSVPSTTTRCSPAGGARATRDDAIRRMRRALSEYTVLGTHTPALPDRVLRHDAFVAGDVDTGFVDRGSRRPTRRTGAAGDRGGGGAIERLEERRRAAWRRRRARRRLRWARAGWRERAGDRL